MTIKLWLKIFLSWLLFVPVAIINGLIRNYLYQPVVGDLAAHQLSTLSGVILWLVLIYLMLKKELLSLNNSQLFIIGLVWLVITVVFEFGFGHYVIGHSWFKLVQDYNLLQGRVWSLFLLVVLGSPVLVKRFIK